MRYDRVILLDVLVAHQRQSTQYCRCGWGELGMSHPEHVATMYEQAVIAAGGYSHDGVRGDKVIRVKHAP